MATQTKVSFTSMADGTAEDFELVQRQENEFAAALPGRVLAELRRLDDSVDVYRVSRLEHSLQSATRAHRDGRSEDYVVMALIHDIGDSLAPHAHGELVAAILQPYVSEELVAIAKYHPVFQGYYYFHHLGGDRNARDRYRDETWFEAAAEFCEKYDQNCFDPDYETLPLSFFEPMVERVLGREPAIRS